MALLGLLTALCTVLRIVKVPIPNVQPVTDILMIVTLLLGFRWGFSLTMSTLICLLYTSGDCGVWHGKKTFRLGSSYDYSELNEAQVLRRNYGSPSLLAISP